MYRCAIHMYTHIYVYIYVYSNFLILTLLQSTEKLRSAQGYINTEDQIRTKLSLSFIFMEQTVTMCLWEKNMEFTYM